MAGASSSSEVKPAAHVQVAMLIGQSVLLGLLVDYFSEVGARQVQVDCLELELELPAQYSTRDAYLAALGEDS